MVGRLTSVIFAVTSAISFFTVTPVTFALARSESSGDLDRDGVVATALTELCDEQIVLIGEAADHGGGATLDVKAQLVRALLEQCGFDALLFESGFYDFAKIYEERSEGALITDAQISSSIGAIWNRYAEVDRLVPVLTDRVNADRLILGGLDHFLGSAGAFYSIEGMPSDLADLLEPEMSERCQRHMRRLIYFSYGPDGPSDADVEAIRQCSEALTSALALAGFPPARAASFHHMVENMRTYADSIQRAGRLRMQARAAAMVMNYQWWRSRLGPDSKIIVWAASVHIARSSRTDPRYGDITTLGEQIADQTGVQAHFVNFATVAGTYRFLERPEAAIPDPVPGSVEAMFSDLQGYRYLGPIEVNALGVAASTIYRRDPVISDISEITDSLIVIGREHPPTLLN